MRARRPLERRSPRRGRLIAQVAVLLAALMIGGTDAYFLLTGTRATAVTAEDALADFRSANPVGSELQTEGVGDTSNLPGRRSAVPPSPPAAGEPLSPAAVVDDPGTPAPAAEAPAATQAPPPAETATPAPSTTAAPEAAPEPRFARPAAGVYTYATAGYESISLAGGRHDYPAESQAILQHADGCEWTLEHRVLEEHVDLRDECSADDAITLSRVGSRVTFFGTTEESILTCSPPKLVLGPTDGPGTTRSGVCSNEDTRADEVFTYLDDVTLTIGGVTITAAHVLFEGQVSGRSTGWAKTEAWLDPVTGMPIKMIRDAQMDSQAFGAQVRYEEHAEFELLSLTPRT